MARILKKQMIIPKSLDKVFAFFSIPENLNKVTPSFLKFKIISDKQIEMKLNQEINYKLKLYGIPFKWKARITIFDPPYEFQDTQIKGPYKQWIHTHTFEEVDDGVLMTDTVEYLAPGWIFEPIINKLIVGPRVKKIFEFRTEQFEKIFRELE
ncbi:MAG: SRPBCC family protein [Candidatus Heimdallarchaeota archaeon]|nr:SRPBCC family protein [Candidatus Heimdallarchaeota archaeon]